MKEIHHPAEKKSVYEISHSTSQEREKSFLWYTRENNFIRYLDEAMGRIKEGTFGLCKECGELIPHARLKEVPHTTQCVNCKNENQS